MGADWERARKAISFEGTLEEFTVHTLPVSTSPASISAPSEHESLYLTAVSASQG